MYKDLKFNYNNDKDEIQRLISNCLSSKKCKVKLDDVGTSKSLEGERKDIINQIISLLKESIEEF